ncbi:ras guanine nucleotide exchange factor M-like [Episyrphus balteatus]|uniref:ras guanine nucleotide exchange factor M-like n=1 Tax=Episyrphus balteatus TaxID=286459 RepID=UPI002484F7C6|nr:ras guanine nucleotide exchange factor M-like [Episyrphus balteatus]XP_055857665.1 ras guanine nucleotide exchange factor M-like [Episyrphus balteatus]
MDDEILKTVHSIFGKSVQIVDCEKTSSVRQEEVLLINGIPVTLDGHDGEEIKNALLTGQVPSVELLNQLLYQAGILKQSVQLETSLSVKSSMITTEEVSVARGGQIVDGRTSETKEDYAYSSSKKEIWNPITTATTTTKITTTETMSNTPRFRLAPEQSSSQSTSAPTSGFTSTSDGAIGGQYEKGCSPTSVTIYEPLISVVSQQPSSASNFTNESLSSRSGSIARKCHYNYEVKDNDYPDEDEDDDDDDDEDGELYLLNPPQYSGCAVSAAANATTTSTPPFKNRLPPIRNTTTTISNSSTTTANSNDDLLRKYQKAPSLQSGRKSSLLSFDSGHDGVFHSPSQQTYNNQSAPVQQLTTNNTDHSISSCYDFISSDEADFLTATNNSSSNMGKYCDTKFATPERNYADLQQLREQSSNFAKSSYDKNVKSPTLGKKPSMSSSSCVSINPLSSQPKQQLQQQQQQHGAINKSNPSLDDVDDDHAAASADISASTAKISSSKISSTTSVENGLVFRDGNLISGPLDALIAHMVPSAQYYPDRSFIFSFLLSARLFIRPHELLAKISDTWENQQQQQIVQSIDVVDEKYSSHQQPQSMCGSGGKLQMYQFPDEQMHQKAMKSAQNCIQLLSEWIDTFPYDFRDERLMQHVRVLARKCVYIDNSLGKTVSSILQQLVQRLTVLEKYEEFLQTLTANETNEQQTNEDLAATHQKSYLSVSHGGGHTNSGYVHASSTSSSNDREDLNSSLLTESANANSQATGSSSLVGMPPHKSLSSSYTTASGTCHQHQSVHHHHHHHHHHHSQQSDSSSNSVNTLGPGAGGGGGGLGISISGCTSSSAAASNGAELTGICDICPNAALLAHQLTHIELERLSHIGPEEFVQAFAKENHLESFSDMKKTRNLESYVQWFNRLSYFTATEIVKYPKKKQRVRIIEFWIETARECFNIGNFNSLMAIIAGLNLSPISRLKKTWSKIQSAKFSVLEHQMDPTSNFNSYRSTLKAAMWRSEGATNERERIIIPFFSLLVKDLYFLNEGCSNRLPNGHINFEKFWQLAKQVMEFNTWKKVTCPFEKIPKVIMFLQLSTVLNENTLSMASFECEPPENTQEKGRYKTLKSETKQQQQQQT